MLYDILYSYYGLTNYGIIDSLGVESTAGHCKMGRLALKNKGVKTLAWLLL